MVKKILKGIGITFLVLISLFVLLAIWTANKSSAYKETAIPYLNSAIVDISNWDAQTLKNYMTPSSIENATDEDISKIMRAFSKLGELKELGEFEFINVSSKAVTGGGSGTYVTYLIPASYTNGEAQITVTLKEEGESFSIYNFSLNSMALID